MTFADRLRSATFAPLRVRSPLTWLLRADALYRQRRTLAEMEPHRLADIGVTRHEAEAESARPVWDAPESWWDNSRR